MKVLIFTLFISLAIASKIPLFRKEWTANRAKPDEEKDPEEVPGMLEGDIDATPEQIAWLYGNDEDRQALAQQHSSLFWPGKHVPYTIHSSLSSRTAHINEALADLNTKLNGCITIKPRVAEPNYIQVSNVDSGCFSSLGYRAIPEQKIQLQNPGCMSVGTIQHEFIHALGVLHEQAREDRDNFVTVNFDNIRSGLESQFNKVTLPSFTTYGVDYNYASVMHYGARAFSKNGELTIIPKNGVSPSELGQRSGVHSLDLQKLFKMYGCGDTPLPPPDTCTAANGFSPQYKNDRWCDVENNVAACQFDGGDCCPPNPTRGYCENGACAGSNCCWGDRAACKE